MVERHRIQMAPGHRYQNLNGKVLNPDDPPSREIDRECSPEDVGERQRVRNQWWSHRLRTTMWMVWHGEPGDSDFNVELARMPWSIQMEPHLRFNMMLDTMDAGQQAWSADAELLAMEGLQSMVEPGQFDAYVLTGMFMERSRRSQAIYIFRKCRPTVVMLPSRNRETWGPACALCLHPIAFYTKTFAGGMVPTDDVIAHLSLMRADEHRYWRLANQHPIDRKEAGI